MFSTVKILGTVFGAALVASTAFAATSYPTGPMPTLPGKVIASAYPTGPMPTLPGKVAAEAYPCLLYTSPSPRDGLLSRMPSSA